MTGADRTTKDQAVLRGENLGRVVGTKTILSSISFEVAPSELLGIVGPSGSGKSSLLRLLNRLDEPTSGTAFLDRQDYRQIPPRELRRRVGMVTQRPFLFPGDVAANLRFGPAHRGQSLSEADIASLLDQVGLPGFAGNDAAVLSGGEQQRVSLARTLANQPEVLLLDEPTSALDDEAKRGIEGLIAGLAREHGLACVMVTHDRDQARRICQRVVLLEAGRLVQTGTVMEVLGA